MINNLGDQSSFVFKDGLTTIKIAFGLENVVS